MHRLPRTALAVVALLLPAGAAGADAPAPAPGTDAPGTDAPGADAPAPDPATPSPAEPTEAELLRLLAEQPGEVLEIEGAAPPGAHAAVDRAALERAEHDDIHKVLAAVAGVYLRPEDGYGLRPNIGMRGAAAERSAKVALHEEGVPLAPAPYSAPAAYYFPLLTRMAAVEVLKGPSAVVYGPNTVGGAIDLVGEPMPDARAAYLDLAGGTDQYGKLHARAAEVGEAPGLTWGAMAEYATLRSDGFKQLDGGGATGFDRDDAQLWLRLGTPAGASRAQRLDLRVGVAAETSNETYLGLTDADFAATPQRRYAATADDRLRWEHRRLRLDHHLELGPRARLRLTAYRNDFARSWQKLEGFWGQRDLASVLADPTGSGARWYALLTGAADTADPDEELLLATGDRAFVSQGAQALVSADLDWGPVHHALDAGVRLHLDAVDRVRVAEGRAMVGGALAPGRAPMQTQDQRAETVALALHARDQLRVGRVQLTAGTRVEAIRSSFTDRMAPADATSHAYAVVVPGGGVAVDVTDRLAVLAGVHRGFSPSAPEAGADGRAESSRNWEAGARWRDDRLSLDALGFFSDYANLTGTCTLAAGCTAAQEGDAFDGGRVHVWGVEAQLAAELVAGPARIPVQAAYTWTGSAFRTAFSSAFGQWGDVEVGDELPYLPAHQLALSASVVERRGGRWELGGAVRWQAAARDVAGQGEPAPGQRTEASLALDLDAHLRLTGWSEVYATCANLLDEQAVVSRRPLGARPASPRTIVVGIKARY